MNRLIIAGSRQLVVTSADIDREFRLMFPMLKPTDLECVVTGCAPGPDSAGERWALEHCIKVQQFPADWGRYGRAAGPVRNQEMADYGTCLMAFYDGRSKGTADMIRRMKAQGKRAYVIQPRHVLDTDAAD